MALSRLTYQAHLLHPVVVILSLVLVVILAVMTLPYSAVLAAPAALVSLIGRRRAASAPARPRSPVAPSLLPRGPPNR